MYLLEWGHTVIEPGAGGRPGLNRLIAELALLDIDLTDLSGFDFVKKIAIEGKTMAWNIIAFTAVDDNEPRNHATELGILGCLTMAIIVADNIRVTRERHLTVDRLCSCSRITQ